MKQNIIITGSSGLVATELIFLLKDKPYNLFLLSTNPAIVKKRYENNSNIFCFDLDTFLNIANKQAYQCLIHTAFARSSEGDKLVKSLEYNTKVLELAKNINLKSYINISSQGVYGQKSKPLWNENTIIAPSGMYALAKSSAELLTNKILKNTSINYTNIRLASVCENARFLNVFVKNAINNVPIKIIGGQQKLSFIDVRDVALALYAVILKSSDISFNQVYNLGTNQMNTIESFAREVKNIGERDYNLVVTVLKEEKDITLEVGMDSTLFMNTFLWQPVFSQQEMLANLYEYILNQNG